MIKITKRDLIKSVVKRYEYQYFHPHKIGDYRGTKFEVILNRLKELDLETATEHDIFEIIGNYTWTEIRCDECNNTVEIAIEFNVFDEYTFTVCEKCLNKAIKFIKETNRKEK